MRLGLGWLFLTFLSFVAFSAVVSALSTFFLSEDLRLLLVAPVPADRLFHSRFARTVGQSSWMVVAFLLPVLGTYRESLLVDLYDAARIVDTCDHIHFFQRTLTARDMLNGHDLDINTLYACLAGTTKHVGTSMVDPAHVEECLRILHAVAGGEAAWRAGPFVSQSNCFVVRPLKFAEDACRCLEVAARGGMPVLLLSAAQAGATSPAALAGTVVQAVAECLAGLVYINCVVPGAVAIWGPWPFVSDLRTGAMSGGSGEQALITSACAQMGRR